MIKNKIELEVKKDARIYSFYCEIDSPLGELHDVLAQMKSEIVARIKAAEEAEKPQDKKECANECKQ